MAASSSDWEEVETAKKENRFELMLHGTSVNKRIEKSGLDNGVFELKSLNNLKIAGTPLESISDNLGNLKNLTALSLQNNQIKVLPDTIGALKLIKTLDVSGNKLSTLPDTLVELTNIQVLNANLNELKTFPNVSSLKRLSILLISRNQLTALPDGICDESLSLLNTIEANDNCIEFLPAEMGNLSHLAKLNVASNKLDTLPYDLSESPKLKELVIADNKMKDRKMLKLADHSTKSLLNYLGTLLDKQQLAENKGKKDNKKKQKKQKGAKKEDEEGKRDVISVLQFKPDEGLEVSVTDQVMGVRQYIVCCIMRNLNFTKTKNMFKSFISLQTKLHETVCEKRQSSTIATHDLKLVNPPLVYNARLPEDIHITPLFKNKSMSAQELMKELRDEADAQRKEKKKNSLSGVHKYLDLLKGKSHYPCLQDADGDVISFPPITNSEKSKISKETTDILVEVTSSVSLEMCKKTMEELLVATLVTGAGSPDEAETQEGEASESFTFRMPQSLTVEQVKVLDPQGNLRVIYPSRVDLDNPAFDVSRNYE